MTDYIITYLIVCCMKFSIILLDFQNTVQFKTRCLTYHGHPLVDVKFLYEEFSVTSLYFQSLVIINAQVPCV